LVAIEQASIYVCEADSDKIADKSMNLLSNREADHGMVGDRLMIWRFAGRFLASTVILVTVLVRFAFAAIDQSIPPGKWAVLTFDAAKTTIGYNLAGWPHVTNGTFKLKRGTIRVDPVSGRMLGSLVVDAASGDSGHSVRDARMNNSVLEVQGFPEISFEPKQVESHGTSPGEFPVSVRGVMTIHGSTHPLTVVARVERHNDTVVVHCNFAIPYVAWGLKDPSILFFTVAKEVDVEVTAVSHLEWMSPQK
jgi:polyisoprenoid-binding protein YceI